MEDETFTNDELEYFRRMCEAAKQIGFNWPLAVATFPAETDGEKRWKNRTLRGIPLSKAKGDKNHSQSHRILRNKPQRRTDA
jgi:hypothetical protein